MHHVIMCQAWNFLLWKQYLIFILHSPTWTTYTGSISKASSLWNTYLHIFLKLWVKSCMMINIPLIKHAPMTAFPQITSSWLDLCNSEKYIKSNQKHKFLSLCGEFRTKNSIFGLTQTTLWYISVSSPTMWLVRQITFLLTLSWLNWK